VRLCNKGALFWKWASPIRKTYRVAYVTSVTYSQTPAATYSRPTVRSSTVISTLTYILLSTGEQGLFAHPVLLKALVIYLMCNL